MSASRLTSLFRSYSYTSAVRPLRSTVTSGRTNSTSVSSAALLEFSQRTSFDRIIISTQSDLSQKTLLQLTMSHYDGYSRDSLSHIASQRERAASTSQSSLRRPNLSQNYAEYSSEGQQPVRSHVIHGSPHISTRTSSDAWTASSTTQPTTASPLYPLPSSASSGPERTISRRRASSSALSSSSATPPYGYSSPYSRPQPAPPSSRQHDSPYAAHLPRPVLGPTRLTPAHTRLTSTHTRISPARVPAPSSSPYAPLRTAQASTQSSRAPDPQRVHPYIPTHAVSRTTPHATARASALPTDFSQTWSFGSQARGRDFRDGVRGDVRGGVRGGTPSRLPSQSRFLSSSNTSASASAYPRGPQSADDRAEFGHAYASERDRDRDVVYGSDTVRASADGFASVHDSVYAHDSSRVPTSGQTSTPAHGPADAHVHTQTRVDAHSSLPARGSIANGLNPGGYAEMHTYSTRTRTRVALTPTRTSTSASATYDTYSLSGKTHLSGYPGFSGYDPSRILSCPESRENSLLSNIPVAHSRPSSGVLSRALSSSRPSSSGYSYLPASLAVQPQLHRPTPSSLALSSSSSSPSTEPNSAAPALDAAPLLRPLPPPQSQSPSPSPSPSLATSTLATSTLSTLTSARTPTPVSTPGRVPEPVPVLYSPPPQAALACVSYSPAHTLTRTPPPSTALRHRSPSSHGTSAQRNIHDHPNPNTATVTAAGPALTASTALPSSDPVGLQGRVSARPVGIARTVGPRTPPLATHTTTRSLPQATPAVINSTSPRVRASPAVTAVDTLSTTSASPNANTAHMAVATHALSTHITTTTAAVRTALPSAAVASASTLRPNANTLNTPTSADTLARPPASSTSAGLPQRAGEVSSDSPVRTSVGRGKGVSSGTSSSAGAREDAGLGANVGVGVGVWSRVADELDSARTSTRYTDSGIPQKSQIAPFSETKHDDLSRHERRDIHTIAEIVKTEEDRQRAREEAAKQREEEAARDREYRARANADECHARGSSRHAENERHTREHQRHTWDAHREHVDAAASSRSATTVTVEAGAGTGTGGVRVDAGIIDTHGTLVDESANAAARILAANKARWEREARETMRRSAEAAELLRQRAAREKEKEREKEKLAAKARLEADARLAAAMQVDEERTVALLRQRTRDREQADAMFAVEVVKAEGEEAHALLMTRTDAEARERERLKAEAAAVELRRKRELELEAHVRREAEERRRKMMVETKAAEAAAAARRQAEMEAKTKAKVEAQAERKEALDGRDRERARVAPIQADYRQRGEHTHQHALAPTITTCTSAFPSSIPLLAALPHTGVTRRVFGLANLGNTCYFNAVLQALLCLPAVYAVAETTPTQPSALAQAFTQLLKTARVGYVDGRGEKLSHSSSGLSSDSDTLYQPLGWPATVPGNLHTDTGTNTTAVVGSGSSDGSGAGTHADGDIASRMSSLSLAQTHSHTHPSTQPPSSVDAPGVSYRRALPSPASPFPLLLTHTNTTSTAAHQSTVPASTTSPIAAPVSVVPASLPSQSPLIGLYLSLCTHAHTLWHTNTHTSTDINTSTCALAVPAVLNSPFSLSPNTTAAQAHALAQCWWQHTMTHPHACAALFTLTRKYNITPEFAQKIGITALFPNHPPRTSTYSESIASPDVQQNSQSFARQVSLTKLLHQFLSPVVAQMLSLEALATTHTDTLTRPFVPDIAHYGDAHTRQYAHTNSANTSYGSSASAGASDGVRRDANMTTTTGRLAAHLGSSSSSRSLSCAPARIGGTRAHTNTHTHAHTDADVRSRGRLRDGNGSSVGLGTDAGAGTDASTAMLPVHSPPHASSHTLSVPPRQAAIPAGHLFPSVMAWLSSTNTIPSFTPPALAPRPLRRAFVSRHPWFDNNEHHDAHEALLSLMSSLSSDYNTARKHPYQQFNDNQSWSHVQLSDAAWRHTLRNEESVFTSLTQGQLMRTTVCLGCGHVSRGCESISDLCLSVQPDNPLSSPQLARIQERYYEQRRARTHTHMRASDSLGHAAGAGGSGGGGAEDAEMHEVGERLAAEEMLLQLLNKLTQSTRSNSHASTTSTSAITSTSTPTATAAAASRVWAHQWALYSVAHAADSTAHPHCDTDASLSNSVIHASTNDTYITTGTAVDSRLNQHTQEYAQSQRGKRLDRASAGAKAGLRGVRSRADAWSLEQALADFLAPSVLPAGSYRCENCTKLAAGAAGAAKTPQHSNTTSTSTSTPSAPSSSSSSTGAASTAPVASPAVSFRTLYRTPPVLVVQLRRFKYDPRTQSFAKDGSPVAVKPVLTLRSVHPDWGFPEEQEVSGDVGKISEEMLVAANKALSLSPEVPQMVLTSNAKLVPAVIYPQSSLHGADAMSNIASTPYLLPVDPAHVPMHTPHPYVAARLSGLLGPLPVHATDYTLRAVVMHSGGVGGGHYTCYGNVDAQGCAGSWFYFDDASVRHVSEDEVLEAASRAYLLFYSGHPRQ